VATDMMMRVKDQVLIVPADYQTCKLDTDAFLESDIERTSREIAKRVISNYAILAKIEKNQPFLDQARDEVEALIRENAKLKRDPWASCRDEGTRIRVSYAISRIIEAKAGKRHKFSVWSGIVYGIRAKKLIPERKGEASHRGTRILIAAPSAKKAVEALNEVLGLNENLSNFRGHWTGGGTLGNKVATKIGIWIGIKDEQFPHSEDDYKLIWEPK